MITTNDQEDLFRLIADYLEKDISCIAIGGTAMMLSNYKTTTKDIDLVFESKEDRNAFIKAIEALGYKKRSLKTTYDQKRQDNKHKPLMYSRGEERFDLFTVSVFGYEITAEEENTTLRQDFLGKQELTIKIPTNEELILLKAITSREKDMEDIETILSVDKDIDWHHIVDLAIRQKENNEWILIDLEKALQQLKKKYFIKQEILEKIYAAQ